MALASCVADAVTEDVVVSMAMSSGWVGATVSDCAADVVGWGVPVELGSVEG